MPIRFVPMITMMNRSACLFTVRQYWGSGAGSSFVESFRRQRDLGERILPRIVRPLAQAIALRS